eukprot:tig00000053_g23485.t1
MYAGARRPGRRRDRRGAVLERLVDLDGFDDLQKDDIRLFSMDGSEIRDLRALRPDEDVLILADDNQIVPALRAGAFLAARNRRVRAVLGRLVSPFLALFPALPLCTSHAPRGLPSRLGLTGPAEARKGLLAAPLALGDAADVVASSSASEPDEYDGSASPAVEIDSAFEDDEEEAEGTGCAGAPTWPAGQARLPRGRGQPSKRGRGGGGGGGTEAAAAGSSAARVRLRTERVGATGVPFATAPVSPPCRPPAPPRGRGRGLPSPRPLRVGRRGQGPAAAPAPAAAADRPAAAAAPAPAARPRDREGVEKARSPPPSPDVDSSGADRALDRPSDPLTPSQGLDVDVDFDAGLGRLERPLLGGPAPRRTPPLHERRAWYFSFYRFWIVRGRPVAAYPVAGGRPVDLYGLSCKMAEDPTRDHFIVCCACGHRHGPPAPPPTPAPRPAATRSSPRRASAAAAAASAASAASAAAAASGSPSAQVPASPRRLVGCRSCTEKGSVDVEVPAGPGPDREVHSIREVQCSTCFVWLHAPCAVEAGLVTRGRLAHIAAAGPGSGVEGDFRCGACQAAS